MTPDDTRLVELAERLTDKQREIILAGGGEIDCDEGYSLIDMGIFAKMADAEPDDEYQGFDFTPLGRALADSLRARTTQGTKHG